MSPKAPLRRDSNSMSVSHSRVAATVRFLAAASERVVSSWRLIVARFSSRSFCSSGIIGFFLLGLKNKGVVGEQRQWIGDQLVQPRVAEPERRLFPARALLLPQNVGDGGTPLGPAPKARAAEAFSMAPATTAWPQAGTQPVRLRIARHRKSVPDASSVDRRRVHGLGHRW